MRSRTRLKGSFGRMLDANELCGYLGMGKNRALQFAEECGAKRKFGKSARYDREVIDARLNEMSTEEQTDATDQTE